MESSYDLVPDFTSLETLFILESPYKDEIANGIPCCGKTGRRMAWKILKKGDLEFGKLLNDNDSRVKKYGVMNTFPFPLDLPNDLTKEQKKYTILTNELLEGRDRDYYFDSYSKRIQEFDDLEEVIQYRERINEYIDSSPSLKNIVLCGFIAESVFVTLFGIDKPKFRTKTPWTSENGSEVNLLFVNHPSPKNDYWLFSLDLL